MRQAHDFLRDGQREEASRVLEGVGYTDSQVDRVFGAYDANVSAGEAKSRKRLGKLWTTKRVALTEFVNFLYEEDFLNDEDFRLVDEYERARVENPSSVKTKDLKAKMMAIAERYGKHHKERKRPGYTLTVNASKAWQKKMAAGD